MFSLFNKAPTRVKRQATYFIIDKVGATKVDKEYAELGLSEGWLKIIDYHLTVTNTEIYKLELA